MRILLEGSCYEDLVMRKYGNVFFALKAHLKGHVSKILKILKDPHRLKLLKSREVAKIQLLEVLTIG